MQGLPGPQGGQAPSSRCLPGTPDMGPPVRTTPISSESLGGAGAWCLLGIFTYNHQEASRQFNETLTQNKRIKEGWGGRYYSSVVRHLLGEGSYESVVGHLRSLV